MCLVCRFWKIWPDALCSACVWCSTLSLYPPQLFATQNDQLLLRNGLETKDLQSEADFRAYQGWILGFTVRRTPYFLEHITMLAKCFLKSNSPGHKRLFGFFNRIYKISIQQKYRFQNKVLLPVLTNIQTALHTVTQHPPQFVLSKLSSACHVQRRCAIWCEALN